MFTTQLESYAGLYIFKLSLCLLEKRNSDIVKLLFLEKVKVHDFFTGK